MSDLIRTFTHLMIAKRFYDRAVKLHHEEHFYRTKIGDLLRQEGMDETINEYTATIDEGVLFLLFCQQYFLTKE